VKIFGRTVFLFFLWVSPLYAIDTAPRVSDREIIQGLAELKVGQSAIQQQMQLMQQQMQQQMQLMQQEIQLTNKRIDDLQESMNKRFDILQWIFALFIAVTTTVLGAMGKILWGQQREMGRITASIETQKDELAFFKTLIEKMLPPRGIL
jgi:hypothetical protein